VKSRIRKGTVCSLMLRVKGRSKWMLRGDEIRGTGAKQCELFGAERCCIVCTCSVGYFFRDDLAQI
jgi:hypothetical protein